MCNLYTATRSAAEVAALFGAKQSSLFNIPDDILPGRPGMVVREQDGERVLQSLVWGFPLRLKSMKPESKPKPVNNIADLRKPMWIGLARKPEWRCLIPVTELPKLKDRRDGRREPGLECAISRFLPGRGSGGRASSGAMSMPA